ncbi:TIM44-like domain-containing protein [Vagococcus fluvialis]|uniref:Tim44-like domain-containing protein n=5 Tax=Vagococcus fluvialis TaxID=2738 RepID=A0A369B3P9_9ENTE|nr:TIM44-like domain-containing protein [Vagococcus fluvialis]MDT2746643.1 TIM44-like domain-containing protein [Vagococcus fluvialis]MDT2782155.1 TIM44-like domain-containing protein [Vagococcus fluvialis]RCX15096.1 Tim44-like domain-containing protein [Vagococcus fluvialis]RSU05621.1 hypothetical protein CBF32_01085 [Vagococcus fluvialis]UDM80627.1 TIM44-like domain-containing protein [Vagococcus fluvialis]
MRKKILNISLKLIICLIIVIIIYHFYPILVEARAGGGGSTGGSSSSSDSEMSLGKFLMALILLPFMMIKNMISNWKENLIYTDVDNLEKWEYKVLFLNVQSAWTSNDMKDVQDRMDPTLYEDYQQKLLEYQRVNKRNILTDIQIEKVKVSKASRNRNLKEILFEGTIVDYFEVNGELPHGEIKPVTFKDIWIIERIDNKLIVRDIQNL